MYAYVYIYVYTCICLCECVYMYIHTYVYIQLYMQLLLCVYMHIYIYMYMYIYIYIYIYICIGRLPRGVRRLERPDRGRADPRSDRCSMVWMSWTAKNRVCHGMLYGLKSRVWQKVFNVPKGPPRGTH